MSVQFSQFDAEKLRTQLYCADMPGKRVEEYFAEYGPIPIIDITYDVHLRRRPLYYVIYMILPTTVISFMSLLAFLLPSDSGEKIGLGRCIDHYSTITSRRKLMSPKTGYSLIKDVLANLRPRIHGRMPRGIAHTTSYSTLIETVYLPFAVFEI